MHTDPHDSDPHDPDPAPDVLALDLESLRTVDHPVLAALVEDLRERVAASDGGALWGFDNAGSGDDGFSRATA